MTAPLEVNGVKFDGLDLWVARAPFFKILDDVGRDQKKRKRKKKFFSWQEKLNRTIIGSRFTWSPPIWAGSAR